MPFQSLAALELEVAGLLHGAPPTAWRLSDKQEPVPPEVAALAVEPPRQPFPGVWELRALQGHYDLDWANALVSAAKQMDDRVYLDPEPQTGLAVDLLTSRIGDSPFAYVIGVGGKMMACRVGERFFDLLCVIRRRDRSIPAVWHRPETLMSAIRRRMPDVPGMVFHFDAGYFELGMTEPQHVIRPVVLISATFTPAEEARPVWADAMVVPVTKLIEDDDEGFGSWRNHEFC